MLMLKRTNLIHSSEILVENLTLSFYIFWCFSHYVSPRTLKYFGFFSSGYQLETGTIPLTTPGTSNAAIFLLYNTDVCIFMFLKYFKKSLFWFLFFENREMQKKFARKFKSRTEIFSWWWMLFLWITSSWFDRYSSDGSKWWSLVIILWPQVTTSDQEWPQIF